MKNRVGNNKTKYLVSAGCLVAGLGFIAPLVNLDNGGKNRGPNWYNSIPPIDNRAAKPVSGGKQKVAVAGGGSATDAIVNTAKRALRQHNLSQVAQEMPITDQPAIQSYRSEQPELARLSETQNASWADAPDTTMFSQYVQKATWQPVNQVANEGKPGSQTARRKSSNASRNLGKSSSNPSKVVKINPAGEHNQTEKADSEKHESDGKWYDWLWPLGHRVGVDKLKDEYVPFQTEESDEKAAKRNLNTLPDRPDLMVELGDGFLDTGNLHPGFEIPLIGAVWQPRLWGYLINRTAIQTFDDGASGAKRESEVANRLDIFFNLQLTGTEKILLGLRPVDRNRPGDFTRYTFSGIDEGFNDNFRIGLETLFFEGDFGSLFPVLDKAGFIPLDFGFTVGRQPLIFQEGTLINDTIDAVGFIRNNIPFPGTSNFRVSGIYGWNRVDRNDGKGGDEQLFGLFTAADTHLSTLNLDLIYVEDGDQDGFYAGVSSIQRLPHFGGISTAFRANSSFALEKEVAGNVVGTGVLLTTEISKTVKESDDIVYFNSFLGIGNYTQAGREAINGGPLANTGILFASPNLSTYLAEVNPFIPDDVIGGAIGYQAFWDDKRRNLILEIAGRHDLSGNGFDSLGFGFQLQQAVGQHIQLQLEAFYTINEDRKNGSGARAEILFVL